MRIDRVIVDVMLGGEDFFGAFFAGEDQGVTIFEDVFPHVDVASLEV